MSKSTKKNIVVRNDKKVGETKPEFKYRTTLGKADDKEATVSSSETTFLSTAHVVSDRSARGDPARGPERPLARYGPAPAFAVRRATLDAPEARGRALAQQHAARLKGR